MLPRSQRLSGEQLDLVMEKGRVTHSSLFWLRALEYDGKTRIAAIVPQKIVKKAVGRNLLRRKMYGAIQPQTLLIKKNYLIVICAKTPAIEARTEDLAKEITNIFVKSKLLE